MENRRLFTGMAVSVILVCILLLPLACRKKDQSVKTAKVIGFSVVDMQPNFFQDMEKGIREACEKMGFEYKFHDQKYDSALLVSGCENLLTRGIDALIVSPCEPSALPPVVNRAKNLGIPVVICDIGGGGSDYDVIVISDCFGGGAIAADYMAEQLNKRPNNSKKIGVLKCMPGHVYAVRRGEGFTKRIRELGFEVVSTLCANDVRDQGYRVTQDMMTAHPDIAGIFCENDPMALGAVQAVRDAGKSAVDDILVVGFNADPEAVETIKAGYFAATIQQVPYEMGSMSVILADKLLNNHPLTFTDVTLREITIPVRLITRENVLEYFPDK
jgi:ribose transport system substrate-binding protein